jgi:hypothetical protein
MGWGGGPSKIGFIMIVITARSHFGSSNIRPAATAEKPRPCRLGNIRCIMPPAVGTVQEPQPEPAPPQAAPAPVPAPVRPVGSLAAATACSAAWSGTAASTAGSGPPPATSHQPGQPPAVIATVDMCPSKSCHCRGGLNFNTPQLCELCEMWLNSLQQMHQHEKGVKHRRLARREQRRAQGWCIVGDCTGCCHEQKTVRGLLMLGAIAVAEAGQVSLTTPPPVLLETVFTVDYFGVFMMLLVMLSFVAGYCCGTSSSKKMGLAKAKAIVTKQMFATDTPVYGEGVIVLAPHGLFESQIYHTHQCGPMGRRSRMESMTLRKCLKCQRME